MYFAKNGVARPCRARRLLRAHTIIENLLHLLTTACGPKSRKKVSAPISAIGGLSGLLLLTMSFVGHDPYRKSRVLTNGCVWRRKIVTRRKTYLLRDVGEMVLATLPSRGNQTIS
jgi:hypothetical protein